MVRLTADALARKRARQVAKTLPALARDLGPEYQPRFAEFARSNPPGESARVDGVAFGAWIARRRGLTGDARVELMVAKSTLNGCLEPRRAPYVAATATR